MKIANGLQMRALGFEVGHALEEDRLWVQRLNSELQRASQKETLNQDLLLQDEEVLEELLANGFGRDSIAALPLLPLVVVAWSDRHIADSEKSEILAEADRLKIPRESPAYQMLTQWLEKEPTAQLETLWGHFVKAYAKSLTPNLRLAFIEHLKLEMRKVAIVSHVLHHPILSRTERKTIDRMCAWFEEFD